MILGGEVQPFKGAQSRIVNQDASLSRCPGHVPLRGGPGIGRCIGTYIVYYQGICTKIPILHIGILVHL